MCVLDLEGARLADQRTWLTFTADSSVHQRRGRVLWQAGDHDMLPASSAGSRPSNVRRRRNSLIEISRNHHADKELLLASTVQRDKLKLGRRVAILSIVASAALAMGNVIVGLLAGSTSVVAAGLEFAGDILASAFVLVGMLIATKPADSDHPYGHGRFETLAGFMVGIILAAGGVGICWRSLQKVSEIHASPGAYAVWPLLGAILIRSITSTIKFRSGRRIQSASLVADAWNDAVDILSSAAALVALSLTLYGPSHFLAADHFGGFTVGLVVIFTGIRVMRDTSLDLMDTMPEDESLEQIRSVALSVPGVMGVEKCFARKTGLQHHVDLHLEVDPELTVREAHDIATLTRIQLCEQLDWIADVLVHIEPAPAVERYQQDTSTPAKNPDRHG
jgi:cation diffusion facilitator family transporter